MKVTVFDVSRTRKGGYPVAYCRVNGVVGTVLATEDVTGPGEYWLSRTLANRNGEIVVLLRVEALRQQ